MVRHNKKVCALTDCDSETASFSAPAAPPVTSSGGQTSQPLWEESADGQKLHIRDRPWPGRLCEKREQRNKPVQSRKRDGRERGQVGGQERRSCGGGRKSKRGSEGVNRESDLTQMIPGVVCVCNEHGGLLKRSCWKPETEETAVWMEERKESVRTQQHSQCRCRQVYVRARTSARPWWFSEPKLSQWEKALLGSKLCPRGLEKCLWHSKQTHTHTHTPSCSKIVTLCFIERFRKSSRNMKWRKIAWNNGYNATHNKKFLFSTTARKSFYIKTFYIHFTKKQTIFMLSFRDFCMQTSADNDKWKKDMLSIKCGAIWKKIVKTFPDLSHFMPITIAPTKI